MSILKKFIVLLTVWAYVLQASAAVSLEDCRHASGKAGAGAIQVVAESPRVAHHDHAAMMRAVAEEHHSAMSAGALDSAVHAPDADTSAKPSDCCSCDCQCGSHGCSSHAPGLALSRAGLDVGAASSQVPTPLVASPLKAHTFGLIRPPSIS